MDFVNLCTKLPIPARIGSFYPQLMKLHIYVISIHNFIRSKKIIDYFICINITLHKIYLNYKTLRNISLFHICQILSIKNLIYREHQIYEHHDNTSRSE